MRKLCELAMGVSEMSDVKYDSEKLNKDAQELMDSFRLSMKKIAEETLGELYVNIMPYAETDSWTNYREALRLELEHEYKYSKFKNEWARDFRRAVFVENREEISKLIEKDILERIKHLEDIKQEYDMFRYSPGGDRYQDKVNENTKLQAALNVAREQLSELEVYISWRADDLIGDDLIGDQKHTKRFNQVLNNIKNTFSKIEELLK